MFDELTHDLLDLTASMKGTSAPWFAAILDCCCCSCCGCLFWC